MRLSRFSACTVAAAIMIGPGATGVAHAAADGCESGVESDFNGDGRSDTVVADPSATVDGAAQAGRVTVLYGDADGLVGEGARAELYQGLAGVGNGAEAGDRFGFALAVADLDCDGYTDLVVGVPAENLGALADAGVVHLVWGAAGGLGTGEPAQVLTTSTFGAAPRAGDQFGFAVDALEDVGQGGTPAPDAYALAVGAPGRSVSGLSAAGWVGFRMPNDGGGTVTEVTQDTPGIPGFAEAGDRFGAAVALGFLVGREEDVDAVIGSPNEAVGAEANAGSITLVRDIYFEDLPEGAELYTQDSAGVPNGVEAGDRFGRSLDAVQVGDLGHVAVGVPGEDIGAESNAGMVQLFSSGDTGLTPGPALHQDTSGVSGVAEAGDLFGDRVAFAAPGGGDALTRLAVSTPREDSGGADTGQVQVFPLTNLSAEVTYSQATAGVPGAREAGDRFGSSLAVVAGATERVLVIGVPDDVGNATGMVNVIPLGGGAARFWKPGAGGIPAGGASHFGAALAGVTG